MENIYKYLTNNRKQDDISGDIYRTGANATDKPLHLYIYYLHQQRSVSKLQKKNWFGKML